MPTPSSWGYFGVLLLQVILLPLVLSQTGAVWIMPARFFCQIEEPGSFAFNHMIRGHVKDMNLEQALQVFDEMLECGVEPDNFTYPPLLKACANLPALKEGKQIHGHCFKLGFGDDLFVQNSLINMYGKCGEISLSCAVFDKMEQRSVASWSSLIAAHASLGMWEKCLEIFRDLGSEGCWRAEESMLVNVISACTLGCP